MARLTRILLVTHSVREIVITKKYFSHLALIAFLAISITYFPFFKEHFTFAKWVTFYLFSSLLSIILFKTELVIPKINFKLFISFFTIFLFPILTNKIDTKNLIDISFWILLVLVVWQFLFQNLIAESKNLILYYLNFLSVLLISIAIYQAYESNFFKYFKLKQDLYASFGNNNMAAHVVGTIILLQFLYVYKSIKQYKFTSFILLLNFAYLYILFSRATFLALFFSFSMFFLLKYFEKLNPRKIYLAGFTLFSAIFTSLYFIIAKEFINSLPLSLKARIVRSLNSLEIIKNHPFGIGSGQFHNHYLNYANHYLKDPEFLEVNLINSSHNSYLDIIIEYGIPYAFIILSILIYFYIKNLTTKNEMSGGVILVSSFFAVINFFDFSMKNATTFYLSSFVFAFLSFKFLKFKNVETKLPLKIGYTLCLSSLLFFTTRILYSKYYENEKASIDKNKIACEIYPHNWLACINIAKKLYQNKNFEASNEILVKILKRHPDLPIALRLAGRNYLFQNDVLGACRYFKRYDEIYFFNSSIHKETNLICSDIN